MSRKKKGGEGGGDEWLATYGDMMTLLLCFFVLLYSMSTIDQKKWEILVRSFNPNAKADTQIVTGESSNEGDFDVEGSFELPEVVESDFDELYYSLMASIEFENITDSVQLEKGEGYTFVTFKDNVFFEGDSYTLTDQGKRILDIFATSLEQDASSIGEIQIMGHTSQAEPDRPNNVRNDRFLASDRATEVLVYIQQKNIIPASKLVASGYGQFRPIAGFDTPESRGLNRRVEMLITESDTASKSLDEYYKEIYADQTGTEASASGTNGAAATTNPVTTTPGETTPAATTPAGTNTTSQAPAARQSAQSTIATQAAQQPAATQQTAAAEQTQAATQQTAAQPQPTQAATQQTAAQQQTAQQDTQQQATQAAAVPQTQAATAPAQTAANEAAISAAQAGADAPAAGAAPAGSPESGN